MASPRASSFKNPKNPTRTPDDTGDRQGGKATKGGTINTYPGLPRGGNVTSKGPYGGSNTNRTSNTNTSPPQKSLIDRVLEEFEKDGK